MLRRPPGRSRTGQRASTTWRSTSAAARPGGLERIRQPPRRPAAQGAVARRLRAPGEGAGRATDGQPRGGRRRRLRLHRLRQPVELAGRRGAAEARGARPPRAAASGQPRVRRDLSRRSRRRCSSCCFRSRSRSERILEAHAQREGRSDIDEAVVELRELHRYLYEPGPPSRNRETTTSDRRRRRCSTGSAGASWPSRCSRSRPVPGVRPRPPRRRSCRSAPGSGRRSAAAPIPRRSWPACSWPTSAPSTSARGAPTTGPSAASTASIARCGSP